MRQTPSAYSIFIHFVTGMQLYNVLIISLLSATAWWGIPALVSLFALCFVGVHIALLAKRGFFVDEPPAQDEPPPQEKKPESPPPPEPVYYIVEKKRKSKPSYSAPKQIKFK